MYTTTQMLASSCVRRICESARIYSMKQFQPTRVWLLLSVYTVEYNLFMQWILFHSDGGLQMYIDSKSKWNATVNWIDSESHWPTTINGSFTFLCRLVLFLWICAMKQCCTIFTLQSIRVTISSRYGSRDVGGEFCMTGHCAVDCQCTMPLLALYVTNMNPFTAPIGHH